MIDYYKTESACIESDTYIRKDIPNLVEMNLNILSKTDNDQKIIDLHKEFFDEAKINDDEQYNKAINLRKRYYERVVDAISETIL